jgi:hypothetical protein
VPIVVPRVWDILEGKEVPLSSYRGFQNPRSIDEVVFKRLINEISTLKYEKAAHWRFCYVWNQECSFREGCDPALPMAQTGEHLKISI